MTPDEIFRMCFTSGTTGNPKCVLHCFNTTLPAVELLNVDMEVTERDVLLTFLPVGLNWGYLWLLQGIMAGATLVVMERFSARRARADRARAGHLHRDRPCRARRDAERAGRRNFDVSSLRVVITGGASAAVETIRDYQERMKGHLIELYGMLETGFHTYTRFSDDPAKVNGTIGRVVRAMELRIVDEEGNEVPSGEVGEMSRGPSIHLGYHDNADANAEAFTATAGSAPATSAASSMPTATSRSSGAARRSSIAAARSSFRARSRRSSTRIPKILHVAMVGMADARLGERNCLCVVPKSNHVPTLDEFVAFLRDQVADYKLPESIEQFNELPMTGSGKIQRHVLRDLVLKRHGDASAKSPVSYLTLGYAVRTRALKRGFS